MINMVAAILILILNPVGEFIIYSSNLNHEPVGCRLLSGGFVNKISYSKSSVAYIDVEVIELIAVFHLPISKPLNLSFQTDIQGHDLTAYHKEQFLNQSGCMTKKSSALIGLYLGVVALTAIVQGCPEGKTKHQASSGEDDWVADQQPYESTKNQSDCHSKAFICNFDW
jgi:hypothetical protein